MLFRDYSKPLNLEMVGMITEEVTLEQVEEWNRKLDYLQAFPATSAPDAPHTVVQLSQILAVLRKQGHISLWDTLFKDYPNNEINCVRLGARIWDLKQLGVLFDEPTKMITLPNDKKVAMYTLSSWDSFGKIKARWYGHANI